MQTQIRQQASFFCSHMVYLRGIDSTFLSPDCRASGAMLLPGIDARPVGAVRLWTFQFC